MDGGIDDLCMRSSSNDGTGLTKVTKANKDLATKKEVTACDESENIVDG